MDKGEVIKLGKEREGGIEKKGESGNERRRMWNARWERE